MKAFKASIPFPDRKKNDPHLTSSFSKAGIITALVGSFSVWFGWALWASLRVYADGQAGWSILFVVLGFVFGFLGALIFSIEINGELYAAIPDKIDENLHRDWSTPPYRTSVKSFFSYHQWEGPALTRTLFHLCLIVFTIYYLDYTTTFDVASPRDLWIRILVGVLYWMVAAVIARIVCELALALFVVKDHFLSKNIERPRQHVVEAAPVVPIMEDAPAQQPPVVGGGYQQI